MSFHRVKGISGRVANTLLFSKRESGGILRVGDFRKTIQSKGGEILRGRVGHGTDYNPYPYPLEPLLHQVPAFLPIGSGIGCQLRLKRF